MKCRKTVSKRSIHAFARGFIYADARTPWEPLERFSKEELTELVDDMETALTNFVKRR